MNDLFIYFFIVNFKLRLIKLISKITLSNKTKREHHSGTLINNIRDGNLHLN